VKEFSKELVSDRSFEIGGTVLEWRYPYWEELASIFDEDLASLRNGGEVGDVSTKEALAQTIDRVNLFLTDGSRDRWAEVAHRREDPVPLFQISEVYRWLLEISSGRPTQSPSGSEPGGGTSEQSSPDGSPSTEETSTP
jgi:hypothetical protein